MPVAAVAPAGRPTQSSGSRNASFANRRGEKMIFFTCVPSSEITVLRPTSLPVPAVVGTGRATAVIRTGMRIRVNGSTGVVTVLDGAP